MKYSYRITKYWQYNQTGFLISPPEEWTAFSDIEQKALATMEDYLKVENEYLNMIKGICQYLRLEQMYVGSLENYDKIEALAEHQPLNIEAAVSLARRILREEVWCKLKHPICEFHFGYDYYLYCVCEEDLTPFFTQQRSFLNVEEYGSPYFE